jgi:hypothetical protein
MLKGSGQSLLAVLYQIPAYAGSGGTFQDSTGGIFTKNRWLIDLSPMPVFHGTGCTL